MYNKVLDSGGTIKEPGTPLPDGARDSLASYMERFPYRISITIGKTYTADFKEFNEWCVKNLGIKYKDWFLAGHGGINNSKYTLYLKDSKKSMFLALKYSDSIDNTTLL